MKKLLIKSKVIDIPYSPAIEAVEATETEPAIDAVPEQLEVSHYEVIDQTQGEDADLAIWLAGNIHKYPEGYQAEYIDITAEVEADAKLQSAMNEISKGIKGIAVFKVRVKDKGLSASQIAQLFSSAEIKAIIETLSTGSLPLAAALIAAYQADGVIVTEDDKQAVIQAIG